MKIWLKLLIVGAIIAAIGFGIMQRSTPPSDMGFIGLFMGAIGIAMVMIGIIVGLKRGFNRMLNE